MAQPHERPRLLRAVLVRGRPSASTDSHGGSQTMMLVSSLSICQKPMEQASLGPNDGGGMDGGAVAVRSTAQALEVGTLCGNMSGLQPNAPWPMSGGCPGRNAHASEVGPTTAGKRWSFDTFSDVRSSVAIASDGSLIFGADNGIAYRVDPTSGAIRNQLTLGGAIKATPALSADTAYIPSESGKLFAIALSDFRLKPGFPFPTGGAITGSPLILPNGTIVVGSNDTNVRAVSALGTNAPTVWIRKTGGAVSGSAAMSADGATVFIGSQDKFAYAINSSNGDIRWTRQLAAAITSSPALTKFNLVIFTAATTVYALDATTGLIVWQKALGSSGTAASPAIAQEGVILVGAAYGPFAGGSLQAFRPSDGALLFRHDTLGGIDTTPAVDNQGNAYFGTNNGTLHAVNAAGRAIFTHTLPNGAAAGIKSSPVLSAQGLTFGCDDNFIYNFSGARTLSAAGAACTADAECAPTLLCGSGNGPRFGKPAGGACLQSPASTRSKILERRKSTAADPAAPAPTSARSHAPQALKSYRLRSSP